MTRLLLLLQLIKRSFTPSERKSEHSLTSRAGAVKGEREGGGGRERTRWQQEHQQQPQRQEQLLLAFSSLSLSLSF